MPEPDAPPEESCCCFSWARRALRICEAGLAGLQVEESSGGFYFFEIGVGHFERAGSGVDGRVTLESRYAWSDSVVRAGSSMRVSLVCLDSSSNRGVVPISAENMS